MLGVQNKHRAFSTLKDVGSDITIKLHVHVKAGYLFESTVTEDPTNGFKPIIMSMILCCLK